MISIQLLPEMYLVLVGFFCGGKVKIARDPSAYGIVKGNLTSK